MKDNLMPVITPLKTVKECLDTLTNFYEKKTLSQKRELKNKLQNLNMEKDRTIASFFTKISQVRDQIMSIGVTVDDDYLIQIVIDSLPSSWKTFFSIINGQ